MILHKYAVYMRGISTGYTAKLDEMAGRSPTEACQAVARNLGYPRGFVPGLELFARCLGSVGEPEYGACHFRPKRP